MATLDAPAMFAVIAPQFAGEVSTRVDDFFILAAQQMSVTAWGSLYAQGLANLVAHMLTLSARAAAVSPTGTGIGASAGSVTNQSAGAWSIGQSAPSFTSPEDAILGSTLYGAEFLRLRGYLVTSPIVAGVDY